MSKTKFILAVIIAAVVGSIWIALINGESPDRIFRINPVAILVFLLYGSMIGYVLFSIKTKTGSRSSNEPLTNKEKWMVISTELIGSILASSVYYNLLKKDFPRKASQANKYGWIIFGATFVLVIIIAFVISEYLPQLLPLNSR